MSEFATTWLGLFADWSMRWGVLIAGLIVLFAVRPPRSVAVRLWLGRLVLAGGLAMPLFPHWWSIAWPRAERASVAAPPPPTLPAAGELPFPERPAEQPPPFVPPFAARAVEGDGGIEPLPPGVPRPAPAVIEAPIAESKNQEPRPAESFAVEWPVVLVCGWLVGCGYTFARLALGWWWLVRVRRRAEPVAGELLLEMQTIQNELGVRRPVVFLTSPAVAGPVLLGGRRPAVVVPPHFASHPATDRRATLLHELTHVACRDDWARLVEELVRAVFFFHPLVHWLLNRLSADRESYCDAAAVRRGIPPRDLARVLFEGAKSLGPGRSALAPAAIPIFHRNSVPKRIHQLLEADMDRWCQPLTARRATLALVVVLALCAGLGGLGWATAAPEPAPPPAEPVAAPAGDPIPGRDTSPTREVARVGTDAVITDGEVWQMVRQRVPDSEAATEAARKAREKELYREELKKLIERELIVSDFLTRIKKQKPRVLEEVTEETNRTAARQILALRKKNGNQSKAVFVASLAKQGITIESFERQLARNEMVRIYINDYLTNYPGAGEYEKLIVKLRQKITVTTADPALAGAPAVVGRNTTSTVRGRIVDAGGKPVMGATVVVDAFNPGLDGGRMITTSAADGRFTFDLTPDRKNWAVIFFSAGKSGFAPVAGHYVTSSREDIRLVLSPTAECTGTVKDPNGKPVRGAEVFCFSSQRMLLFRPEVVRGTPLEQLFYATTNEQGVFRSTSAPAGEALFLRARAPGFAEVTAGAPKRDPGAGRDPTPVSLKLEPEATIRGQVISRLPGFGFKTVWATLGEFKEHLLFDRIAPLDAEGRFTFKNLPAGSFNIYLVFPTGTRATARATTVTVKAGESLDTKLEIIEGVEVTGTVRISGAGQPVNRAVLTYRVGGPGEVQQYPPVFTDAAGEFRVSLPSGPANFGLITPPPGYGLLPQGLGERRIVIPSDAKTFAISEPFEMVRVRDRYTGRVVDASGKAIANATVKTQWTGAHDNTIPDPVTNAAGEFTCQYSPTSLLQPGLLAPLSVVTAAGRAFEVNALVPPDGVTEVRVPTHLGVNGPEDVKPLELAGVVVDGTGQPLAGVKVHLRPWADSPRNIVLTGLDGRFRISDDGGNGRVLVRFSKEGYSPVTVRQQQVGVKGLVIALDRETYFEGVVRGPDGKPVGGAVVRADEGLTEGNIRYTRSALWTETRADPQGRYRLYVQPNEYTIQVRAAGTGIVQLPATVIGHGQKRTLDLTLMPGVTFRAKVVDSISGKPVAGVKLYDWQRPEVAGLSDDNGEITIGELLPGRASFKVASTTHARWWSDQTITLSERRGPENPKTGFRRNFDNLAFNATTGMQPVTVTVEPAVRCAGRVLDPNGKPVAGATVSAVLPGSGNTLTGDTRFRAETIADGTFTLLLPATGAAEYNLMAHDGPYGTWRTWANGVLPPIKTTPGQTVNDLTLNLTRPAVVRGRVVDTKGRPVAGREICSQPTDGRESHYYSPTTTTKADGTFELRFVRPAAQQLSAAPFWSPGKEPPGLSKTPTLTLKEGEVAEGVTLTVGEEAEK
ncbi:carboxypeptidase regulatory-like domain-containing protein [Fimbriiglobus ruber]|uniref:Regulatory sensor-transducer, BlaR1/MecR1 family n=1 Tax=Fimbriiglobus ruber TaxID=1908690 RepID=A0A225DG29_9BACT|nr:carboxypeptidase regulatory-like domain-containing protein [Fimbriiglobus ruber]OWK40442.1 Regulatory sensor-transducer, BlaR1/MecR1 family [Fimbriiglobus ruber]